MGSLSVMHTQKACKLILDVSLFPRDRGHKKKPCCDHTGELTKGIISYHETVLLAFDKTIRAFNDHLAMPIN